MYRAGFIPSLSKEVWPRQGPGWFALQPSEIPQLQPEVYSYHPLHHRPPRRLPEPQGLPWVKARAGR